MPSDKNSWTYLREKRLEATKERRKKRDEYAKEYREACKARGICVQRGQADALPGLTLCQDCRLYHNQRRSGYVEHSEK